MTNTCRSFAALGMTVMSFATAAAQQPLTATDSALVGRILLAEDRRDTLDAALARGAAHADARIRTMARRAMHRIRDTTFAARDSFRMNANGVGTSNTIRFPTAFLSFAIHRH